MGTENHQKPDYPVPTQRQIVLRSLAFAGLCIASFIMILALRPADSQIRTAATGMPFSILGVGVIIIVATIACGIGLWQTVARRMRANRISRQKRLQRANKDEWRTKG